MHALRSFLLSLVAFFFVPVTGAPPSVPAWKSPQGSPSSNLSSVPQPGYSGLLTGNTPNDVESGNLLARLATQGSGNLAAWRLAHGLGSACTPFNTAVRQEFRRMPKFMRKQFTDAVICMYSLPSHLNDSAKYPGVKNRYDDFPAGHIEFNQHHHFSGTFLSWHRYVIWTFEQELRTKCGYTGYLPYWDWGLDAQAIDKSEIFNGDPYSMGSNGAFVNRSKPLVFTVPLPNSFLGSLPNPQNNVTAPAGSGTGGGCINANGPFGNVQAHLGPTILGEYGTPATGPTDAFKYNPRCIKRDLNPWVTNRYLTYKNITEAVTNYSTVAEFQAVLQSDSRYLLTVGNIGVHAAGHIGAGGDPMADQPSTPGDPIWFLHHAQIDRLWFIWQNQNLASRLLQVAETETILNYPPSANVTLDSIVDLAYIGGSTSPPRKMLPLLNTVGLDGSPFCYIYE